MNNNLQEYLLCWYYSQFCDSNKLLKSNTKQVLFYTYQLIITIFLGLLFSLFWLITPILFLINLLMILVHKFYINVKLFKYSKVSDKKDSEYESINQKIKLILDLDNTLIYSTVQKIDKLQNGTRIDNKFYVYKRPHLDNFLSTLSEFCDLAIYTSSTQEYADKILNFIDRQNVIHEKLYRHNCVYSNNKYFKDVLKLGYQNKKILIIDDNPQCYLNMKENIIHIKFWNGDEKDDSLLKIKNIIKSFYSSGRFSIGQIINSTWLSEV